eukprot:scaffold7566_cov106-Skeletonema_dohrnii-CCMP3373.AAC.1
MIAYLCTSGESLGVNSTPGTKGPVYGVNTASRVPVGALHTAHFSLRLRSEMKVTSNSTNRMGYR